VATLTVATDGRRPQAVSADLLARLALPEPQVGNAEDMEAQA